MADSNIVARVAAMRRRGEPLASHPSVPDAAAALLAMQAFLRQHEVPPDGTNVTHGVCKDFPDWWVGTQRRNAAIKLDIRSPEDLDELARHVVAAFNLGVPLTLTEKRASLWRLSQDIDICGCATESVPAEHLVGNGREIPSFLRLVGDTVGAFFAQKSEFHLMTFSATGMSASRGYVKTTLRLVWVDVYVERDSSSKVLASIVERLRQSEDEEIRALRDRMAGFSSENTWGKVLRDTASVPATLPYCDLVTPLPSRKLEGRPLVPLRVLRFDRNGSLLEPTFQDDDLQPEEWLSLGSLRPPADERPTPFHMPAGEVVRAVAPLVRRFGTHGGSDDSHVPRHTAPAGPRPPAGQGHARQTPTQQVAKQAARPPSQAFAPQAFAPQAAPAAATAPAAPMVQAQPDAAAAPTNTVPPEAARQPRRVAHNFEPETDNELRLTEGDEVTVEEESDGWARGTSHATREQGWFPVAFLVAVSA